MAFDEQGQAASLSEKVRICKRAYDLLLSRLNFDPKDFPTFENTWAKFFQNNQFLEVYFDKTDEFLKYFMKILPKEIKKKSIV